MFGLSRLAGSIVAGFAGFHTGFYTLPDAPMDAGSQYRRHPSAARLSSNKYRPHQGERERARRRVGWHNLFGSGKWTKDDGGAVVGEWPGCRVTPRQPGAFEYVWIGGKRPQVVSRQVRRAEDRRRWKAMRAQS